MRSIRGDDSVIANLLGRRGLYAHGGGGMYAGCLYVQAGVQWAEARMVEWDGMGWDAEVDGRKGAGT